jgi:probable F420-dependent oxidoreductase
MKVGTFLPTYWIDDGTRPVGTLVPEVARAAAALGYASLWANDHVIAPSSLPAMGHNIDPLTALASVMHLAPHLQLGTSTLVLPQRHAVVVARQVATLDALSGGRFILGVGVGWLADEFRFLNADFARRGAVADEAIEAMQTLWREPRATFHGRFYEFSDAVFFPKPAGGRVPLWICGNTPAAIRRAARVSDAWDPFGLTLDDFTAGVASLRNQVQGRPMPTIAAHLRLRIGAPGGFDPPHVAGSVDQVTEELARYRQAGLEYLICDFVASDLPDLLEQMRLMAEKITPALAG